MVGRSSGTQPTRVQILVLAHVPRFFRIYRRYVVSDVPVDVEAPLVTSGLFRFVDAPSFAVAHKDRVCVRVFIGVSVRTCCERLRYTV
jgi:hypothetical protein